MTQEEIAHIFIQTIKAHAEPRPYDWSIFWVAVASVIVSFIAIMFTLWVPKKIADRQDKIALFEKRYEVYVRHFVYIKNAHQVHFEIVNTRFARGKCELWMTFFIRLAFPEDENKWMAKEAERNGKPPIIPAIDKLALYILELKKIRYLFTLDAKELSKLAEIISKLEHSSNDVFKDILDADVDEGIVQVDEFRNQLTELAKLIAESTFHETMEKQLDLKSRIWEKKF